MHRPACGQRPAVRRASSGFTLTELMIVVVIIGVMAAISAPMMTKDNRASDTRDFVFTLARELQHCRIEAVATRTPIRVLVFSDRAEIKSWVPGTTPGAAPVAPAATDAPLRILRARNGAKATAVLAPNAVADGAGANVNTSASIAIDFLAQGGAQLVGQPVPTGAVILIQNDDLPSTSPDFDYRIDVTALTGFVSARAR